MSQTQELPPADQLAHHHCVPCEGGIAPLSRAEFSVYLPQVADWQIIDDLSIERDFTLKNFKAAVAFIDQIADVAESEGHHPDLLLHDYKKVKVMLTTHAIKGLSVNDFVMAIKIDEVFRAL